MVRGGGSVGAEGAVGAADGVAAPTTRNAGRFALLFRRSNTLIPALPSRTGPPASASYRAASRPSHPSPRRVPGQDPAPSRPRRLCLTTSCASEADVARRVRRAPTRATSAASLSSRTPARLVRWPAQPHPTWATSSGSRRDAQRRPHLGTPPAALGGRTAPRPLGASVRPARRRGP